MGIMVHLAAGRAIGPIRNHFLPSVEGFQDGFNRPESRSATDGTHIAGSIAAVQEALACHNQFEFRRLVMREIFRPETLWREVIPLAIFALVVLVIFIIAATFRNAAEAEFAVSWTMRAV